MRKLERERMVEEAERRGVRDRRVTVRVWRRGKRGTRRERRPLKRVTVWEGTSWEKAMRKPVWRGMVPLIVVKLGGSIG